MTYLTYSGTRRTILVPESVNNVTDTSKIVLLVQESISRDFLDGFDSNDVLDGLLHQEDYLGAGSLP